MLWAAWRPSLGQLWGELPVADMWASREIFASCHCESCSGWNSFSTVFGDIDVLHSWIPWKNRLGHSQSGISRCRNPKTRNYVQIHCLLQLWSLCRTKLLIQSRRLFQACLPLRHRCHLDGSWECRSNGQPCPWDGILVIVFCCLQPRVRTLEMLWCFQSHKKECKHCH